MTKATKALSATLHSLNRRAALRDGAIAAIALASPAAADTLSPAAAPSATGRRILALIADQRALDAVWERDEHAANMRSMELCKAIEALGKSITARPIASISDIVDRAILAAWACQPHGGKLIPDDVESLHGAYIIDVLALAGIRPEQCNADFATA